MCERFACGWVLLLARCLQELTTFEATITHICIAKRTYYKKPGLIFTWSKKSLFNNLLSKIFRVFNFRSCPGTVYPSEDYIQQIIAVTNGVIWLVSSRFLNFIDTQYQGTSFVVNNKIIYNKKFYKQLWVIYTSENYIQQWKNVATILFGLCLRVKLVLWIGACVCPVHLQADGVLLSRSRLSLLSEVGHLEVSHLAPWLHKCVLWLKCS